MESVWRHAMHASTPVRACQCGLAHCRPHAGLGLRHGGDKAQLSALRSENVSAASHTAGLTRDSACATVGTKPSM